MVENVPFSLVTRCQSSQINLLDIPTPSRLYCCRLINSTHRSCHTDSSVWVSLQNQISIEWSVCSSFRDHFFDHPVVIYFGLDLYFLFFWGGWDARTFAFFYWILSLIVKSSVSKSPSHVQYGITVPVQVAVKVTACM